MSRTARGRGGPRTETITSARTGLTRDVGVRQRRYLAAMLVRTACVILMAVLWNRWPVPAALAAVGGIVIPYVAVVVAQAGWRQQRGIRPALKHTREEPAPHVLLEPTLILPPEGDTAS